MHILWVQFHPAACFFSHFVRFVPSPILFSPLFPFLLVSACHPLPLFSSFYLFYFFFSSHSFLQHLFSEREREKDGIYRSRYRWFVYIPCWTGPASFIRRFLFTVYAMVNLRGLTRNDGMTRLLGRYPCSIPCVIFFYSALVLVSRMDGKEEWL